MEPFFFLKIKLNKLFAIGSKQRANSTYFCLFVGLCNVPVEARNNKDAPDDVIKSSPIGFK